MWGFAEFVVGLGQWCRADTGVTVCMREWLGIVKAIAVEDGVGVGAFGEVNKVSFANAINLSSFDGSGNPDLEAVNQWL